MNVSRYIGAVAALGVFAALVVSVDEIEQASGPVAAAQPTATEANPASPRSAAAAPSRVTSRAEEERFKVWADGIALSDIPAELERIENLNSPAERAAERRALLSSWTSRDLVAVTRWVGAVNLAHSLQQEGRAQIVEALLECKPEDVVPALRESLPETTARELYGPYFQGWAANDPAAAATMLVRLGQAEPRNTRQWHDLLGQVSALWMASAPDAALKWLKALPEGEGKSTALIQASYRWTELYPAGAAAYAAQRDDPRFIKAVAAKWAETAPASALSWAQTLPAGTLRKETVEAVSAIWAQTK